MTIEIPLRQEKTFAVEGSATGNIFIAWLLSIFHSFEMLYSRPTRKMAKDGPHSVQLELKLARCYIEDMSVEKDVCLLLCFNSNPRSGLAHFMVAKYVSNLYNVKQPIAIALL